MSALLAVAAVATTANAAPMHARASGVTVQVPVPAPQQAEAVSFTVRVKGGRGTPTVHVLNDSAFGNSSAVIAVGVPKTPASTVTYAFVVLVRRFTTRVLSHAEGNVGVRITVSGDHSLKEFDVGTVAGTGCSFMAQLDKSFESSSTAVIPYFGTPEVFTLESMRPPSVQDSPPEEVLDNVLALTMPVQKCPTRPEGDDAGNG
ncbi:MAG TPA: hypothetical protein VMB53_09655 [Gaiellaceae bacterium]|nr:hypothetical protein [Gaiellaceae bacterium]